MEIADRKSVRIETVLVPSLHLAREVVIDFYVPLHLGKVASLLLLNDGQDLPKMPFAPLLCDLLTNNAVEPIFAVGIHAGAERKMEYGTANQLDYEGRGAKAVAYQQFILIELLPYIKSIYAIPHFHKTVFAGFSLGGLMALDAAWSYPYIFSAAGVFSGSLWWRSKGLEQGYNEATDRIMHKQIRDGTHHAGQKFYFTTGSLDETSDRNNNGVIDSIDDTVDLIAELKAKGYTDADICYINFEDGRHDVATWARALPQFLTWAFGGNGE